MWYTKKERLKDVALGVLQASLIIACIWCVGASIPVAFRDGYYNPYTLAAPLLGVGIVVVGKHMVSRGKRMPPYPECKTCGYNLTGNVTGVCSECGTKIESP